MNIPRLEQLSLIKRIALTVAIIIVVLLLIWLIELAARWEPAVAQQPREQLYQGIPLDEHLLEIDKEALRQAYHNHLLLLFSVWLKDDVSVVSRINAGLRNARRAYHEAANRIEQREQEIKRSR